MICLGRYDNNNFTLLNILDVENEDVGAVKVHEIIHMLLALQTKWGCTEYYFNHISRLIDPKYNFITDRLHINCEFVQESLAVFWEKLYIYRKKGKLAFVNAIREEEWKSPYNYKYLKGILKILNEKNDLSIEEIAFCIYRIAVYAMNAEITDIPIGMWECKEWKDEQVDQIKENTPTLVFQNMLEDFWEVLKNGNVDAFLIGLENDWSCADIDNRQQQLNGILEYIKQICKTSDYYQEIEKYLSTIRCREISIDNLDEYIIPVSFTQYQTETRLRICDIASTIIFIYGNGEDLRYSLKNKAYRDDEWQGLYNYVGKKTAIDCTCYSEKRRYMGIVSNEQLRKIMHKYCLTRVISYKAYENNPRLVKQLEYDQIRYYVYCDRPYWSAKRTIQENCKDKKWMVVEYGKFDVICLQVNKYGVLFVPVCCADGFYTDLDTYYSGERMPAKDMFENEVDLNRFNLVINCLFGI